MSHKRSHNVAKGSVYLMLTAAAGVSTVALATLTVGLATSVVGIPLAILTGIGTVGCATFTGACAYKGFKQFHDAMKDDHTHHHPHVRINPVGTVIVENQSNNVVDIQGSSKPFFSPATNEAPVDPKVISRPPRDLPMDYPESDQKEARCVIF